MRVLITSGGTKIPIDLVRSITNMSKGTFGSRICDEFWKESAKNAETAEDYTKKDIVFFHAVDSCMPTAEDLHNECCDSGFDKIERIPFKTFDDYRTGLVRLVKENAFDIIVLAAAVSDYGVETVFDGKYRSSSEDMVIRLKKLPKVIEEIGQYIPGTTCLCGFKLLVKSDDVQLRDAMERQFENTKVDLVIGNDLRDIKADNHRLTVKNRYEDVYGVYTKADCNLPQKVKDECVRVWKLKNNK